LVLKASTSSSSSAEMTVPGAAPDTTCPYKFDYESFDHEVFDYE